MFNSHSNPQLLIKFQQYVVYLNSLMFRRPPLEELI